MQLSFTNELGNQIEMSVEENSEGVMIRATGPNSTVEHQWTSVEARRLHYLLSCVVDK